MFIPHYKLETNPFATDGIRPFFTSESMRYVQLKLEHMLDGRLQSMFLNGPAGVGKSTLVGRYMQAKRGIQLSWVKPGVNSAGQLLRKLVADIGPGDIAGDDNELRRILEVFLKHQVANGRVSVIVVDAMERIALPIIREVEALCRLRLRHRPLVHSVLVTRNEDLIATLLEQDEAARIAPVVHQRLTGFTLEETGAYVRTCLHGAGCSWVDELLGEDAIVDIQAFTQGIVADINALSREALELLAMQSNHLNPPKLTRALLKEAGARLNLRYDAQPWRSPREAPLSSEAVQVSAQESQAVAAKLIVTSGGQQIAEVALSRPRMVLGRDTTCDISLDSSYVSRYQNLFMETADGWLLFDLNSTNGCFVNGRRVREHQLRDGDLIAVGQHQLRFACPTARGASQPWRGEDTIVSPKPLVSKRA